MFEINQLNKKEIIDPDQTQVLVFGSNIDTALKIKIVKHQLEHLAGIINISVDLENWERVLRIECSSETVPEMVVAKVLSMGFICYELVD